MRAKKIFGYIFITLSVILVLPIIGLFPSILKAVFGLLKIFTGTESYEAGKTIGACFYWLMHISLTIVLWVYGRKWIKESSDVS